MLDKKKNLKNKKKKERGGKQKGYLLWGKKNLKIPVVLGCVWLFMWVCGEYYTVIV